MILPLDISEAGNLCSDQVDGLRHVKQLPAYLSVVHATKESI